MENAIQIETLWSPAAPVMNPRSAIKGLQKEALKIVLEKEHLDGDENLDISSKTVFLAYILH